MAGYQALTVWQRAMDLAQAVYDLTRAYPVEERFGFTTQTRRAAASVAANIAEGHGRGTAGDFARFLRIARGSLRECETHLLLAVRVRLVEPGAADKALVLTDEIGRLLHALLRRTADSDPRRPTTAN